MTGSSKQPAPRVQVVVVAFGSTEPLQACLESLGSAFPTTVIDNSSSAQTRKLVEGFGHRYDDPGANLGFAAGVNRALELLVRCPDDILLVNPDATIRPDAVAALHERLHRDPRLACVAPAQRGQDGPARVAWPFPSPSAAWLEAFGLARFIRGNEFLIGSILLIKAAALADVGLFDERYFLYAEETDWQMRAVGRGWKVSLVNDVEGFHAGAGTGGNPQARLMQFHASQERLIRKHYGWLGWHSYRVAAMTGALIRSAIAPPERRAAARERLRLLKAGPAKMASVVGARGDSSF